MRRTEGAGLSCAWVSLAWRGVEGGEDQCLIYCLHCPHMLSTPHWDPNSLRARPPQAQRSGWSDPTESRDRIFSVNIWQLMHPTMIGCDEAPLPTLNRFPKSASSLQSIYNVKWSVIYQVVKIGCWQTHMHTCFKRSVNHVWAWGMCCCCCE